MSSFLKQPLQELMANPNDAGKKTCQGSMKPLWLGKLFTHADNMRHFCKSSPLSRVDCLLLPFIQHLPDASPPSLPSLIYLGSSVAPAAFSAQTVSNMNMSFHSVGTAQKHGANNKQPVTSNISK